MEKAQNKNQSNDYKLAGAVIYIFRQKRRIHVLKEIAGILSRLKETYITPRAGQRNIIFTATLNIYIYIYICVLHTVQYVWCYKINNHVCVCVCVCV